MAYIDTKPKPLVPAAILIGLIAVSGYGRAGEPPQASGREEPEGDLEVQEETGAQGDTGFRAEAVERTDASASAAPLSIQATTDESAASAPETEEKEADKSYLSPFFSPVTGSLYFLGGVGFNDKDPLNARLDNAGFSTLDEPSLTVGIGGDISIGRLIVGTEWHRLVNVGSEVARGDFAADLKTRYWLARLGIDVVKWRGLRIYPLFGIGTAHSRFSITQEQGARFDDVLSNPNREVRMSQRGLLLDASLGIDYKFKIRDTERKSSFFTLGVRGGYLFNPYSTGWDAGSAEISGGPDMGLSGPTVQLLIGFSGRHKKPHYQRHNH